MDKLMPGDAVETQGFGAVGYSACTAMVGAWADNENGDHAGAAYLFSPCHGTNYCVANPNSTGEAATISAWGGTSIAQGDFELTARPVPNSGYLFFHGSSRTQMPFGDRVPVRRRARHTPGCTSTRERQHGQVGGRSAVGIGLGWRNLLLPMRVLGTARRLAVLASTSRMACR